MDRVKSWLYEHEEAIHEPLDHKSEHPLDIRRAYQVACLYYGYDPRKNASSVSFLAFSKNELADCSDTAVDQGNGWVKVLTPHLLQEGKKSENIELIFGDGPLRSAMIETKIFQKFVDDIAKFNWPNNIIVHFDHCDEKAYWSREHKRILVCDNYIKRFIMQGQNIN